MAKAFDITDFGNHGQGKNILDGASAVSGSPDWRTGFLYPNDESDLRLAFSG
jgi:hypothetical protein